MRICGSRSGTESQPARKDFLPRGQLQSSYWLGGGQKGGGVRRQSGSWQSGVDTDWVMNCPTPGRFHRRRILSIEPPSKLVYTWPTEGSDAEPEQVTVSFNRDGTETEVVILHERILVKTRRGRTQRWLERLSGQVGGVRPGRSVSRSRIAAPPDINPKYAGWLSPVIAPTE